MAQGGSHDTEVEDLVRSPEYVKSTRPETFREAFSAEGKVGK